MKPSPQSAQGDLFISQATPLPLAKVQLRHEELVELLGQLLWTVIHSAQMNKASETGNEQDQR
jgi:hypothetical protein